MIDNLSNITPLLVFPNEKIFYFLQILQRKKDNPELGSNSRVIKCYYINNVDYLVKRYDEIKSICNLFNARASINLNPRNYEKVAFRLLQKIADQMSNKDFENIINSYNSVCGLHSTEMDKRWLVDIDTKDLRVVDGVTHLINSLHEQIKNKDYKILALLETVNGYHIITHPFNLEKFNTIKPGIEVHKNNPTLLYSK